MNALIVGDVHGCYHTLKSLVRTHWEPHQGFLVFVGDTVNKGKHSFKAMAYVAKLAHKHPNKVIHVLGNHERQWYREVKAGRKLRMQATWESKSWTTISLKKHLKSLPLYWQWGQVVVTHCGLTSLDYPEKVRMAFHKRKVVAVGKTQVYGHIPTQDNAIAYSKKADAYNLDTRAWAGFALSAVRLSRSGELLEKISVPTDPRDLA